MIVNREQEGFFSALASKTRLIIIELLCKRPRNISELAQALELSATIVARHIQVLEKAGIVRCERVQGDRGLQKRCELAMTGVELTFEREPPSLDVRVYDIPLGQYAAWSVQPTCGLLTPEGILGCYDDPRYFADPGRSRVACLWVGHGYLEYMLPNYLNAMQRIKELSVQMEICSEAPGYAEPWPSDIHFSLNGKLLGVWTSPGDFGGKPGLLSPAWYRERHASQYGQLKVITLDARGTFLDGLRLSDTPISAYGLEPGKPMRLRIESPEDAANPRGFTLFGKGFGNYDQNIAVTLTAENANSKE